MKHNKFRKALKLSWIEYWAEWLIYGKTFMKTVYQSLNEYL